MKLQPLLFDFPPSLLTTVSDYCSVQEQLQSQDVMYIQICCHLALRADSAEQLTVHGEALLY